MRRFELSEGTSNKFWQIDSEGSSLTVTFGRIGTAGQTQTKAFDSAVKAEAERDKLVKEKLKKGYSEVSSDGASAAPAPAPKAKAKPLPQAIAAPPEATPAPEKEARRPAISPARASVMWTEATLREASPIRGSDLVPARAPDAKSLYAKLAKRMSACEDLLAAGARTKHADSKRMDAARAAFAAPTSPASLDLEAQAAAYALVGPKVAWNDEDRRADFICYWSAIEGGSFALRALARASDFAIELLPNKVLALIGEDGAKEPHWFRDRASDAWRGVRLIAALADEAEHARLLKEALAIAVPAPIWLRATLAAGFERPEWCDSDFSRLQSWNGFASWLWPLLVSLSSVDEVDKLLALPPQNFIELQAIDELRYDFVARYGPSSSRLLIGLIGRATHAGVEILRSLAEALALIVTPDVASFFLGQLEGKELRVIAAEYLQSHPELSLVPLAEAAAGKGAIAEAARGVLKTIVACAKDAVAAERSDLTPSALRVIEGLEEQTSVREEASAGELPSVLGDPPWTRKTERPRVAILELTPVAADESIEWRPGERERRQSAGPWLAERSDSVKQNLEKIRVANDSSRTETWDRALVSSWNLESAAVLALLPRKELLDVAPHIEVSCFNWKYHNVMSILVARHGLELVDLALRSAAVDPVYAVEALVRVRGARVAPLMADAFVRLKRGKPIAVEWLLAFPETAALGLIPNALGKPGKERSAAEAALRYVAMRGNRAAIEGVAEKYGAEAEEATRALLDFDPMMTFPAKLPKLPAFWNAAVFTRPVLEGGKKALPLTAVDTLGMMLAFSGIEDPYAGIAEIKEACDPRSLAAFAWDVAGAWFASGAASKEQWALLSLAHFGDDESARKLTPLVRAWPGEAAHARAVVGLDVLAKIGTDVALMHLHGIAQKLKFKGLQEKAREKIDQIAEARGLTAEELADRLVPDLDLDEDGSRSLDFGPRKFRVVFDESLKPAVLDESSKRLPDLPKPKQSDDAEKAKSATEIWKALKKDAKTIASGQIFRLEIAMCSERRWSTEVFRRFLLEHPLLLHLVRRLVWGAYDEHGKILSTFRVSEDRSLADARDDAYDLPADARVGIVHRLDPDQSTAAAWGQIFADYEILQPFEQLSREIAVPTDADKAAKSLDRVSGLTIATGRVLGLDQRGWRRGPPQDGGVVCWYEKPLSGDLVACMDLEPGIFTGMVSEAPEQKLGVLTLSRGEPSWRREAMASFGELTPIAFSELLRDLDSLKNG